MSDLPMALKRFLVILQSQHAYFTEHSSWLLMKSQERLMGNFIQKKISNTNVKRQCPHYVFPPLLFFILFFS